MKRVKNQARELAPLGCEATSFSVRCLILSASRWWHWCSFCLTPWAAFSLSPKLGGTVEGKGSIGSVETKLPEGPFLRTASPEHGCANP